MNEDKRIPNPDYIAVKESLTLYLVTPESYKTINIGPQPRIEIFWCTSHNRQATAVDPKGQPHCDPKLGGIMLPCYCVKAIVQPYE